MALRRNRPSARVILLDDSGNVLLLHVVDSTTDKPGFWITPGGGIEEGESLTQAAAREVFEETGLRITETDLAGPVSVGRGNWEFRGELFYSESWHFAYRGARFEPHDRGWTPEEREFQSGWRWWSPDELDDTAEIIMPIGLSGLVRQLALGVMPPEPLELPWSSV